MGNRFFEDTEFPPIDRVDGKEKVTGSAKFSAEYSFPGMVYGVLAESTIAKGTITAMDTKAAENAPGVLDVITHLNCPKLPGYESTAAENAKLPASRRGFRVFTDNVIRFNGQPVALVVADTFERAVYAASLVKASYNKEAHQTDFEEAKKTGTPLEGNNSFKEYIRGDIEAWKNADVKLEAEYSMPIEVHNPMEIPAITVKWEGEEKVTVYEKTQALRNAVVNISRAFGLKEENVRVISKFVGGAFGSAFATWPHSVAALIGAKKTGRPLKLMITRPQMFTMIGYRPQATQKIAMGCTKEGKIVGVRHDAMAMTSTFREFTEAIVNGTRSLYQIPNVHTTYKVFPLNLGEPAPMRGPGETTGAWALECAMDEMAIALKMDPIEFRLLNYSETDLESNKPFSSKYLKECYQLGMDKIKWNERSKEPASMKEGDWLIGYGVGSGTFRAFRSDANVSVRLMADGTLLMQSAVTDMGPGTATAMVKLAADVYGIPPEKIRFEMGDSSFPAGPAQGGSATVSSLGAAVNNSAISMKKKLADLIKDNAVFHTEKVHSPKLEDLLFENGHMMLVTDRSKKISYGDAIKNAGLQELQLVETSERNPMATHSAHSYAVHFVKVRVHSKTGTIRVDRTVTAVDAGKIINQETANSQIVGAVVGGISMSLMEEGLVDHRYGRWVNNNFADYHVAVNADIPKPEVIFVDMPDPILNPQGSKGMGEVGIVGFASAVANAIYHATGKRIREIPITSDKLI